MIFAVGPFFHPGFAGESGAGPVDFQGKFWPGVDSESTRAAGHDEGPS